MCSLSTVCRCSSVSVQALRFYNLFNTSLLKRMNQLDQQKFTTPPLPIDVHDNVTRGNDVQTTAPSTNIRSRAHIVLIVSYMRSGSTLTADIMQHFPGAFYVFEPFHSIVLRTRRGQALLYTNGTSKYVQPRFNLYSTLIQRPPLIHISTFSIKIDLLSFICNWYSK